MKSIKSFNQPKELCPSIFETELSFDKLPEAVKELHQKLNKIEQLFYLEKGINNAEELWPIEVAAPFLKLSIDSLYRYVNKKMIPYYKPTKRLWFLKSELIAWIKEHRISCNSDENPPIIAIRVSKRSKSIKK